MKNVTIITETRINKMVKDNIDHSDDLLYLLNCLKSNEGLSDVAVKEIKKNGYELENFTQFTLYISNSLRGLGIKFEKYLTIVDQYDLHYVTIRDFNALVKEMYDLHYTPKYNTQETSQDAIELKPEIDENELNAFNELATSIKTFLNIDVNISIDDHINNYKGTSHKNALGLCIYDPNTHTYTITIDQNFVHEWYMYKVLDDVTFITYKFEDTIEKVICHELAHLTRWRHGKKHNELTDKYYQAWLTMSSIDEAEKSENVPAGNDIQIASSVKSDTSSKLDTNELYSTDPYATYYEISGLKGRIIEKYAPFRGRSKHQKYKIYPRLNLVVLIEKIDRYHINSYSFDLDTGKHTTRRL